VNQEQTTLYSILPADHISLIIDKRRKRDAYRAMLGQHFERRQKIALRLNESEAAFDDCTDGLTAIRDPAGRLREIEANKVAMFRVRAEMEAALETQRAIKQNIVKANAEFEAAVGGIQTDLLDMPEIAEPEPGVITTNTDIHERRRKAVADAAVKVLAAYNGRISGIDLASLLGVSSHGIDGLIGGDERIVKRHDGRLGNVQTFYELND